MKGTTNTSHGLNFILSQTYSFPLGLHISHIYMLKWPPKFSTFNKGLTFSFTGKGVNEVFHFGPAAVCVVAESRNTSSYYFLFHNDWNHKKTEKKKYANRTTSNSKLWKTFTMLLPSTPWFKSEGKVSGCISKPGNKTTPRRLSHVLPFLYCPPGRSPRDQSVFAMEKKKKQNRNKIQFELQLRML